MNMSNAAVVLKPYKAEGVIGVFRSQFIFMAILFTLFTALPAQQWQTAEIPQAWHEALVAKCDSIGAHKNMSERVHGYLTLFAKTLQQDGLAEPEHVALAFQVKRMVVERLDGVMAELGTAVSIAKTINEAAYQKASRSLADIITLRTAVEKLSFAEQTDLATANHTMAMVVDSLPGLHDLLSPTELSVQQVASSGKPKGARRQKKDGGVVAACVVGGILCAGIATAGVLLLARRTPEVRDELALSGVKGKEKVKSYSTAVGSSDINGQDREKMKTIVARDKKYFNDGSEAIDIDKVINLLSDLYVMIRTNGIIKEGDSCAVWLARRHYDKIAYEITQSELLVGRIDKDNLIPLYNVPQLVRNEVKARKQVAAVAVH